MREEETLYFKTGWIFTALMLFSLIMFMPMITGQEWSTYGNDLTILTNNQYSGSGNLSLSNNISIGEGFNISINHTERAKHQVLTKIYNYTDSYIFTVYDNKIRVYDKTLTLRDEVITSNITSQFDIVNFDGGSDNEFIGIFRPNTTSLSVEWYKFINYDLSLSGKIYIENMGDVSGLRCITNECYFYTMEYNLTSWNGHFYIIDKNNYTQYDVNEENFSYTEPPSFTDMDNDGVTDFLTYSEREVMITDKNGNEKFHKTYPYNYANTTYGSNVEVIDAKFIKNDVTNQYKVAILIRDNYALKNITIEVFKIDKTKEWSSNVFKGSVSNSIVTSGGFVVLDYNNDNIQDIMVTAYYQGTNLESYKVYSGNNGTLLVSYTKSIGLGVYENPAFFSLTSADLDNDDKSDFIVTSKSGMFVYNGSGSLIFNKPSSFEYCMASDLDVNGYLDLLCSNDYNISVFYSLGAGNVTDLLGLNVTTYTLNDSIIGGVVSEFESFFPSEETLTTKQKLIFIVITMIILFLIIVIPSVLASEQHTVHPIMLYLALFLEVLAIVYFTAIGYISVGVIIFLILMALAFTYFKLFNNNR